MNTRRDLLFILGAGALSSQRTLLAQQQQSKKTHQIGFLTRKKDASVLTQIEAFRQKLHDLGWIEGSNINIEYRDADGELNRLDSLALELVNLNVDVILRWIRPQLKLLNEQRVRSLSLSRSLLIR